MPPITTDCQYGFTDMLYMANSLEKLTDSSFYFKPILADSTCFLRMHSTSTAQGAYIDNEKVTVNYDEVDIEMCFSNHAKTIAMIVILHVI